MIVNNATDLVKNSVSRTEKGNWKVGNRYMDSPEEDKGELYLLNSSWLEALYWNRDTRTCTVYFQQFATNGKEPVVLWDVDGRKIRRFRESQSPGRFYLKQFSQVGYGNDFSMNLEVLETALDNLQEYLPAAFGEYLTNLKTIKSVFENPALASARYIGNILKNTFKSLGFPIINQPGVLVQTNPSAIVQSLNQSNQVLLGSVKTPPDGLILNKSILLKGFSKIFLPLTILQFVIGLPISISNEVKNNLKIIGIANAKQKAINTNNISFLRRTTELKTKLLLASSFSNPERKVKSIIIKPLQTYKNKLPLPSFDNPIVKKIKETQKKIYEENKQLIKIKTKSNEIKGFKQRNSKRIKKLKTYKTIKVSR